MLAKALAILQTHHTPESANPLLKQTHFKQLLINMGHEKIIYEADGPRKGKLLLIAELRQLFWDQYVRYHPDVESSSQDPDVDEDDQDSDQDDQDSDRNSEAVPYLVGAKVRVFWPGVGYWYEGVVTDVDQSDATYYVHYKHDDAYEWHDLSWKSELLE